MNGVVKGTDLAEALERLGHAAARCVGDLVVVAAILIWTQSTLPLGSAYLERLGVF